MSVCVRLPTEHIYAASQKPNDDSLPGLHFEDIKMYHIISYFHFFSLRIIILREYNWDLVSIVTEKFPGCVCAWEGRVAWSEVKVKMAFNYHQKMKIVCMYEWNTHNVSDRMCPGYTLGICNNLDATYII